MPERLLHLEKKFEGMLPGNYDKASDYDETYNCIAFAGGDCTQKWEYLGFHWHSKALKDDSYYALESLYFHEGGYVRSVGDSGSCESGFEKIAIYADRFDNWTHAAHQREDGQWESKCGNEEDIRHSTPAVLEGVEYGRVVQYLKRPRLGRCNDTETSEQP